MDLNAERPVSQAPKSYDVESRLRIFVPALFEFFGTNNLSQKQWRKINANFAREIELRKAKFHANNNYLKVEANIYDLIIGVMEGEESAFILIDFINVVFIRLKKNLPDTDKPKLKKTIYSVLINFDHKYRNFVAELAVLNTLLENGYTLQGVEADYIANKNSADFTLYKDKSYLVEVISIHIEQGEPDIKRLLADKISKKITQKTGDCEDYKPFTLCPVLWGFKEELKAAQDLFKNGDVSSFPDVHEPFAYLSFTAKGGGFIHRFCGISDLITEKEITVIIP